ncbi:MAG TPA: hypothetical protein VGF23_03745 [Gaiellaceae bacterium]
MTTLRLPAKVAVPMATFESAGPIQMLTVAFDGNEFRGEILPELDRLKEQKIIRIIDMLVVRKDPQGRVMVSTASDLDWEEATAFGSYVGGLAGFAAAGAEGMERGAMLGAAELADGHLFDEDDVFRVSQALRNNMTAALILIQHTWAGPLMEAVAVAGGIELMNEWLQPEHVLTIEPRGLPEGDDTAAS